MVRYYKGRTSSLRTIIIGIIAEFLFWLFSGLLWGPLVYIEPSSIVLYMSIPTPFAFIIALILMNVISPLKSEEKTETETDEINHPLVETN
jgi:chromate transport protein ChrA